jgi:GNAT superfamily N-acetyltransferase
LGRPYRGQAFHLTAASLRYSINIAIRQADLTDAAVVTDFNLRLARESEGLDLSPACVASGVAAVLGDAARGLYFVAEVSGEIAGQVMITYEWSDWRNGNLWWLQSVYVLPRFRQLGVFRALFSHVRELARKSPDVCGLRLYMHADNARARRCYESLGMRHTKYEVFEMELGGR